MTYSWLTKRVWALFGLEICLSPVNQAVINPEIIQPQQSPVSIRQKLSSLAITVVEQVEAILTSPESRTADKLKAAQLLGKWCGLDTSAEASIFAMELIGLQPTRRKSDR